MYTLLDSGTKIIDNSNGTAPLEFIELIPLNVNVPEGAWFGTGQLQLQLQTFCSVTINRDAIRGGTERFLNPTQMQIGHIAWLNSGFVQRDDRIKYEKQYWEQISATVQLSNTRQDARIEMRSTTNTAAGHAQQSSLINACLSASGISPPPPAPTNLFGGWEIGVGTVCMTTLPGQTEFAQADPFQPNSTKSLILALKDLLPSEIQGLLWTGYSLELGWTIGYNQEASTAVQVPAAPFVLGATIPAAFGYRCINGTPFAAEGSCKGGEAPTAGYSGANVPRFTCRPNDPGPIQD
jgi:hypothetical protein